MEEELVCINDFINIETFVNIGSYETSIYTGVNDFFYSHLKETNVNEKVKLEKIDVFEIKINDLLKLNPSKWTIKFCQEKGLPMKMEDYEIVYKVHDIKINYYSKNPNADTELPRLDIKIILKKNE